MDNIQSWAYGAKMRMGLLLCSINSGSDRKSKRGNQMALVYHKMMRLLMLLITFSVILDIT
jgi:hypothetical protein